MLNLVMVGLIAYQNVGAKCYKSISTSGFQLTQILYCLNRESKLIVLLACI